MVASIFATQQPNYNPSADLNRVVASIPSNLFMYDPYDTTSLFQDNLGTTPVTTDDQQAGLRLDVRLARAAGYATMAAYVAAQPELRGTGVTALVGTAGAATYNPSTGVATTARQSGVANQSTISFSGFVTNSLGLYALDIENTGATNVVVRQGGPSNSVYVSIPAATRMTCYALAGTSGTMTFGCSGDNQTAAFTIHSIKEVAGYHGAQATSTKRPKWKSSGGICSFLWDGLDDCLPTIATIVWPNDTVTISLGARRLANLSSLLIEFSASSTSNAGTFAIIVAPANDGTYSFRSTGTSAISATSANSYSSPVTNVLTGQGRISTDTCLLRINGAQVASASGDQGSGNFGSYVLNIGSRNNGVSAPFNGHTYSEMGFTAVLAGVDLSNAERLAAQMSGISI